MRECSTVHCLRALLISSILLHFLGAFTTDEVETIMKRMRIAVHDKYAGPERCQLSSISNAVQTFLYPDKYFHEIRGINNASRPPIMMQTTCFSRGSLGNDISEYVEARICAHLRGIHYMTAVHVDPDYMHKFNTLFDAFPSTVLHESPTTKNSSYFSSDNKVCPCDSNCHEWRTGLMHSNMRIAGKIFRTAIDHYWKNRHIELGTTEERSKCLDTRKMRTKPFIGRNGTTFASDSTGSYTSTGTSKDKAIISNNDHIASIASLPVIPEVAIHYRCGDNLVTHYGFLPFKAYSDSIPSNATHIYVLAESPDRNPKAHMVSRCAAIFDAFFSYLMVKFPSSIVVVLRGHDIFDDLARLTYANITLCSVSTFCLWPAVSNENAAHYPVTKLIAKESTDFDYGPSFHWMKGSKNHVIRGVEAAYMSNSDLLKLLVKG
jgi:hypothetical protein